MTPDHARRSKIALGLAVIQLLFISETMVADRRLPNPLSPLIWTVLGIGVVVCLAFAAWSRAQARRTE